jgi:hypothetical protein
MRAIRSLAFAAAIGALAATSAAAQNSSGDRTKRVRITYENLTSGQAFSPSVFMSHNAAAPALFTMGGRASHGLARLAEDGNVAPIADMAGMMMGRTVQHSMIGLPTMPGRTGMVELEVSRSHPMVSGAWMLSMTNDGFTGISGVNAYELRQPRTIDLTAHDAGSERNNERRGFLVALMGIQRDPENGRVGRHAGIRGGADAPAAWRFDPARPVSRITITPI